MKSGKLCQANIIKSEFVLVKTMQRNRQSFLISLLAGKHFHESACHRHKLFSEILCSYVRAS
jgi:hypothetical protein